MTVHKIKKTPSFYQQTNESHSNIELEEGDEYERECNGYIDEGFNQGY